MQCARMGDFAPITVWHANRRNGGFRTNYCLACNTQEWGILHKSQFGMQCARMGDFAQITVWHQYAGMGDFAQITVWHATHTPQTLLTPPTPSHPHTILTPTPPHPRNPHTPDPPPSVSGGFLGWGLKGGGCYVPLLFTLHNGV